MANKIRGEVNLTANGCEYALRPSFQAMCEIEDGTNKTIFQLIDQITNEGIIIKDQIKIIAAGLKAAGHKLKQNEIINIIEDLGLIKTTSILIQFLRYSVGA
jgi:hypothetical protein